jgi:hypothetical protein
VLACSWYIAWSNVRSAMMIPIRLEEPWSVTVIGVELDGTIDKMAHFGLTSLCGSRLADTAAMPLVLFPFRYLGDPLWQQHFEAVSDPEGVTFHISGTLIKVISN